MAETYVVGICGSLRDGSYTRPTLRLALDSAASRGADTTLVDLREYDLPIFDADDPDAGDADALRAVLEPADTILLGTPMYHGSYGAPLKNAIDYCGFDEFEETTVGLIAVSGGSFPTTALDHLRTICRALNAWVLPHQVAIPRAREQFEDRTLADADLRERVEVLGTRAVEYANIEPDPAPFESEQNVGG